MNKNKNNKPSLERSHSFSSNFVLTLVSILGIVLVSAFWILIAFKSTMKLILWIICLIVLACALVGYLVIIKKFKR